MKKSLTLNYHFPFTLTFTFISRGANSKSKVGRLFDQKLKEEKEISKKLERVSPLKNPKKSDESSQDCRDLRTALDDQHKKRMEAFEIQFKPIIIRDGPSKKVRKKFVKAAFPVESNF